MANEHGLMSGLLGLDEQWQISESRLSADRKRIDVWVVAAREKTWFGLGQRAAPAGDMIVWRHLAMCGVPCFVHAPASQLLKLANVPWAGDAGIPFSRAMTREIITLLAEGVKYQTICILLNLPFADLWKYKFAFDRGTTASSEPAPQNAEAAVGLPAPDDPVWESLLSGDFDIDARSLSLKLLITRLRSQMRQISEPDARYLKIRELQRYFSKHEAQLGSEIAQIGHQIRKGVSHV